MEIYSGAKTVKAKAMTKGTYILEVGATNSVHSIDTYGYLVGYPGPDGVFDGPMIDGCYYLSWSPANVFEAAYHKGGLENATDGYHSFKELYEYRKMYNALIFNEWAVQNMYSVHKSFTHADGELCFDGKYFVVVAELPAGQVTNHYEIKDWELFQLPIKSKANVWDGHSPQVAVERLEAFIRNYCKM